MNLDHKTGAEAAAELSEAVSSEPDVFTYTHYFSKPFTFRGVTHEQLTFDWGALTGNDHMAIETEMLRHGKTLIVPEYTSEFLCGMAVRACTARNDENFRVLNTDAMKAMPMRDFQTICKRARNFLLHAGS